MGQNFTTMKTLFYSLLLGLIVPVLLGCGITRGFQDKPTLTTSLDDAVFDLPIMDEFEPVDYHALLTWKAWNYANWRLQGGEDDEGRRPNTPRRK